MSKKKKNNEEKYPTLLSYFMHVVFESAQSDELLVQAIRFCNTEPAIAKPWWKNSEQNDMPLPNILRNLLHHPEGELQWDEFSIDSKKNGKVVAITLPISTNETEQKEKLIKEISELLSSESDFDSLLKDVNTWHNKLFGDEKSIENRDFSLEDEILNIFANKDDDEEEEEDEKKSSNQLDVDTFFSVFDFSSRK
ncbi:MAG: hypothetical protein ACTTKZ_04715 [Bacteroides sp.]